MDKVNENSAINWDPQNYKSPSLSKDELKELGSVLSKNDSPLSDKQIETIKKALNDSKLSSVEVKELKELLKNDTISLKELEHITQEVKPNDSSEFNKKIFKDGKADAVTSLFDDPFLGKLGDSKVLKTEKIVDKLLNSKGKGEFADNVKSFYDSLEGMTDKQVIKVAEFLGDKMSKTDGNDEVLGSLLKGVLNKLQDNKPDIFDILKEKMPDHIKPHFPEFPDFPPHPKFPDWVIVD